MKLLHRHFIYLFMAVLGLHCCDGFSLTVVSGDYSLVVVHWLLMDMVSLVVEHRLQGARASVAVAHGLNNCYSWILAYLVTQSCTTFLQPHEQYPIRFLCPCDFPSNKETKISFSTWALVHWLNKLWHMGLVAPWWLPSSKELIHIL